MALEHISEKEILPVDDEDRAIPTRLSVIDSDIKFIKDNIARMQDQLKEKEFDRESLINRAKELHITTDKEWKIVEIPIYPRKRVDVDKLKQLEPDRYLQILGNVRSRLHDKVNAEMEKADTFVSQSDVKSVIRDKAILAMVIPEPKEPVGYEVSVVKR